MNGLKIAAAAAEHFAKPPPGITPAKVFEEEREWEKRARKESCRDRYAEEILAPYANLYPLFGSPSCLTH